MAVKKTDGVNGHFVDVFWDSWLNGVKSLCQLHQEWEKIALQVFAYQKEFVQKMKEQFEKIERETNEYAKEFKNVLQQNGKSVPGTEAFLKNLDEWTTRWEEIGAKLQKISVTPVKAGFDWLAKSQSQTEVALKSVLDQQQKQREELQKLVESFAEQMRTAQKTLFGESA
jgi:anion-transporting  ArsA/GET3 family ATPase